MLIRGRIPSRRQRYEVRTPSFSTSSSLSFLRDLLFLVTPEAVGVYVELEVYIHLNSFHYLLSDTGRHPSLLLYKRPQSGFPAFSSPNSNSYHSPSLLLYPCLFLSLFPP